MNDADLWTDDVTTDPQRLLRLLDGLVTTDKKDEALYRRWMEYVRGDQR